MGKWADVLRSCIGNPNDLSGAYILDTTVEYILRHTSEKELESASKISSMRDWGDFLLHTSAADYVQLGMLIGRVIPIRFIETAGMEDLRHQDFTAADLRGINLSHRDLEEVCFKCSRMDHANFSKSMLEYVYFGWVTAPGANFSGARLGASDFTAGIFHGADFRGVRDTFVADRADFSSANFLGAELDGAELRETIFTGANLEGTCLDPGNTPNSDGVKDFEKDSDGMLIGYRTKNSPHVGTHEYKCFREYSAPIFSTSSESCHPGLYVCPTIGQAAQQLIPGLGWSLIKVKFKAEDLHTTGCRSQDRKYRVRKFYVVRKIPVDNFDGPVLI